MRYLDRAAVLCTATREAYTGIMTGNVVDISLWVISLPLLQVQYTPSMTHSLWYTVGEGDTGNWHA